MNELQKMNLFCLISADNINELTRKEMDDAYLDFERCVYDLNLKDKDYSETYWMLSTTYFELAYIESLCLNREEKKCTNINFH